MLADRFGSYSISATGQRQHEQVGVNRALARQALAAGRHRHLVEQQHTQEAEGADEGVEGVIVLADEGAEVLQRVRQHVQEGGAEEDAAGEGVGQAGDIARPLEAGNARGEGASGEASQQDQHGRGNLELGQRAPPPLAMFPSLPRSA
jgi:hypothetical protein